MLWKKIFYNPLVKIAFGIIAIVGAVGLIESLKEPLFGKTQLASEVPNGIIGAIQIAASILVYILLYRTYEKRKISELGLDQFWKYSTIGFLTGLVLQTLNILVLYFGNGYRIVQINPATFLIPGLILSIIAGFVAEILLRGVLFRITEEKLGTVITLILSAIFFAIIHGSGKHASVLSVLATTVQAGLLISAAYVFSRSLWLPIFLHFAWDFAEPAIYGGINPGISVEKTLISSKISGITILTGGEFGPGNSIQSIIICTAATVLFLWLAKRKGNFIKPYWRRNDS